MRDKDIVKISIPVDLIARIDYVKDSRDSVTSWIVKILREKVETEERG